jgi:gas vesicle protein
MERESHGLSGATWIIGAAAIGAAAMYLFDPEHGRRRRALAMDKMDSVRIKTRKAAERKARDLSNRAQGILAETRHMLPEKENQPDMQGSSLERETLR